MAAKTGRPSLCSYRPWMRVKLSLTSYTKPTFAAPRALISTIELLARIPEIEEAVSQSAERIHDVLDEVLERVRPIENELSQLNESAADLERRLAKSNADLEGLSDLTSQLAAVAARLEGSAEHLLDRFPGLSSEKAIERADEVIAATSGGIDGN